MQVLQSMKQVKDARNHLMRIKASCIEGSFTSLLRRLKLVRDLNLGDFIKSWDVLETINFLDSQVKKTDPILDIGCYASEILPALHRIGYTKLTGVDLNPLVNQMPYQEAIQYDVANFMYTNFPDGSFAAITSISVIEHGFSPEPLLREMARLLKEDGIFIASFDYSKKKIDTSGTKFFGMDWLIFSKEDVIQFINTAKVFGLIPLGELNFECSDLPIECADKKYTFGWLAFKKQ
jgi:SAM-dependent methyltransferase